jgi:hypothetical protein
LRASTRAQRSAPHTWETTNWAWRRSRKARTRQSSILRVLSTARWNTESEVCLDWYVLYRQVKQCRTNETINSMFELYNKAAIFFVHLQDFALFVERGIKIV